MKIPPFYDIVGAVVTLLLLCAVIAYPLVGRDIPTEILAPFSAAMGWVFRGAAQVANDYTHQRRTNNGN